MFDISWFNKEVAHKFTKYSIEQKSFGQGDFGALEQVIFDSTDIGGNLDFWEYGWLGIFIYDYNTDETLLNVMISPNEVEDKKKAFDSVFVLLGI